MIDGATVPSTLTLTLTLTLTFVVQCNDDIDSGLYSMFTCSPRLRAVCDKRRSPAQDPSWCSWWFAVPAWSNPSPSSVRSLQSSVTYSQPPAHALQPPWSASAPRSHGQAARSTSYCTHYKTEEHDLDIIQLWWWLLLVCYHHYYHHYSGQPWARWSF